MLNVYYDSETDTLSLWNGRPASEGADVADNLTADFDAEGEKWWDSRLNTPP